MSYTVATIQKATQILESRRSKAQQIQLARHAEVTDKIPEIIKLEAELSESGLKVIKAFGMGKDAQKYIAELAETNLTIQKKIKELLTANGYSEDYLETPFTCKNCEDTGFVGGYSCDCRKELLKETAKNALSEISQSKKCRFDNFNIDLYPESDDVNPNLSPRKRMSDIVEFCKCYAEDFDLDSFSLYLHGATGLGKTHISLAIANVVAEKGYNVYYETAHNLVSVLEREKFSNNNTGEKESEILDCDLLIIDDLGSEFSTQFTVAAIYNIINTRINRSKPTIINTNLTAAELEAKYTQRVTSRIAGSYQSLLFLGKDIRQIMKSF